MGRSVFVMNNPPAAGYEPDSVRRGAAADVSVPERADALARSNAELKKEVERCLAVEASPRQREAELRSLHEHSHEMGEELRLLTHRLVQAQEDERKRISRELHDDIAQTLVGIQVQLQVLISAEPASFDELKSRIARTQELVVASIDRVQAFARDLRPAMLDDVGLTAALKTHMAAFSEKTEIPVCFEPQADPVALGNAARTALFRVAQSALANVAKHAQASRVEVRLWESEDSIFLEVQDNGSGFEVDGGSPVDGRKRLGLIGMRERMAMVGGTLRVSSAVGIGTTVHAELPK